MVPFLKAYSQAADKIRADSRTRTADSMPSSSTSDSCAKTASSGHAPETSAIRAFLANGFIPQVLMQLASLSVYIKVGNIPYLAMRGCLSL